MNCVTKTPSAQIDSKIKGMFTLHFVCRFQKKKTPEILKSSFVFYVSKYGLKF